MKFYDLSHIIVAVMYSSLCSVFNYKTVCFVLCVTTLLCAASCKKSSSTPTYDVTDATVSQFVLMDNDSAPDLSSTKFIVEDLADTGSIHLADKDSITFGYSLKSVRPAVSYNSVPSAAIWYIGDTSFVWTGYDTLDFTLSPVYLRVYAADREHEKWYRIFPRVHQVDPDKYVWTTVSDQIAAPRSAEQHAMLAGGRFYFFTNDGFTTTLYTSDDAVQWGQHSVTGLPSDCHVRSIVYDSVSSLFCYAEGVSLYTSADGMVWNTDDTDIWDNSWSCISLLMSFDDHVWAVVQNAAKDTMALVSFSLADRRFVYRWRIDPDIFPVSDFAVAPFPGSSDRRHCLVAGGYTLSGEMIGTCWAFEAAPDGCRMVRMHEGRTGLQPFAGAAIVWYGKKLHWYGGINSSGELLEGLRISPTEGMTWSVVTDTSHTPLPPSFGRRWRVSVFTQGDYVWLVGGQAAETQTTSIHSPLVFRTDIFRARLNSVDW